MQSARRIKTLGSGEVILIYASLLVVRRMRFGNHIINILAVIAWVFRNNTKYDSDLPSVRVLMRVNRKIS